MVAFVLVLACGTEDSGNPKQATGSASTAPKPTERERELASLMDDIHRKEGSEKLVTVTIDGPVLILDTRNKNEECRAMMSSVELRNRATLHDLGIKTVRCVTSKFTADHEVPPN